MIKSAKSKMDTTVSSKVKVKELRRGYKNAVDAGTRSGNGKIVKDYFDGLQKIWRGSPSVLSLPTGISSLQNDSNVYDDDVDSEEDDEEDDEEEKYTDVGNDANQEIRR